MEVAITGPDDGDAIALGPIRMRILEDGSTTDHRLGMGEITLPPHTDGPPQHRHARHDEGFYVVSGTASFTVGDTTYEAPAGTLVMVPPGAPHTFANPGDEPAVLLNTFTPDLYVQYFRDLRDMIVAGQPFTPESDRRGDGPLRHRPGHRLRRLRQPNSPWPSTHTRTPDGSPRRPARSTNMTTATGSSIKTIDVEGVGPVEVTVEDGGEGRPSLVLHGGAGPQSVSEFAELLAESPTTGQSRPRILASAAPHVRRHSTVWQTRHPLPGTAGRPRP